MPVSHRVSRRVGGGAEGGGAAGLEVGLTVTRSCTLVKRSMAGRGSFKWMFPAENRLDIMGTQKLAV